jgi:hypothetical protein
MMTTYTTEGLNYYLFDYTDILTMNSVTVLMTSYTTEGLNYYLFDYTDMLTMNSATVLMTSYTTEGLNYYLFDYTDATARTYWADSTSALFNEARHQRFANVSSFYSRHD